MQTITLDQFHAIFGSFQADKSPYVGASERGCLLALAAAVYRCRATFAEIGIQ